MSIPWWWRGLGEGGTKDLFHSTTLKKEFESQYKEHSNLFHFSTLKAFLSFTISVWGEGVIPGLDIPSGELTSEMLSETIPSSKGRPERCKTTDKEKKITPRKETTPVEFSAFT